VFINSVLPNYVNCTKGIFAGTCFKIVEAKHPNPVLGYILISAMTPGKAEKQEIS
jgi:hypothetical protein